MHETADYRFWRTSVGDEEEDDEDLVEFKEQIMEIDQEEFVDEDENDEEESETEARDRIKTSITEKFEETTEAVSNIQVRLMYIGSHCNSAPIIVQV